MELETYEANLADIALQEQTFYEQKPTAYELQMASQLLSNSMNGGHYVQTTGGFPLMPILNNGGKGKKKKSVKFLTYVQVRNEFYTFRGSNNSIDEKQPRDGNSEKRQTNVEIFLQSIDAGLNNKFLYILIFQSNRFAAAEGMKYFRILLHLN